MITSLPKFSLWSPACNGAGKRNWFVTKREAVQGEEAYEYTASGAVKRYASHEQAQKVADKLNVEAIDAHVIALRAVQTEIAARSF